MLKSHFKKFDWILVVVILVLGLIGLTSIYSSSYLEGNFLNFYKQAGFIGLGVFLMLFFSLIDYRNFRDNSYLILILYFICLLFLIGLFFFGDKVRGVKSWYKIGHWAFAPTEFLKAILIILLAKYFSHRHIEIYRFRHIFLSGIYVLLPSLLVYFQPDLGSVLVIIFLWLGILLLARIKLRHLLFLSLIGILVFILAWSFLLKDYQKERIISFTSPEYQPLEIGWSQRQAKIAIGSGGLLGKGFLKGSQTQNGFLSEPQTDFVFSAVAEEFGFVSIIIIAMLFLILFFRILKIVFQAKDNFARLFTAGFGIIIFAQTFINLGTNIGFLPVIGIPLPFVSYGGSFVLFSFAILGIIQNIKINS
jgi:rod shape determining protein RodA